MKYLCIHTMQPNAISFEQMCQVADAAQHDPKVRGCRSFASLTEGKVACIMEGPDRDTVADWFKKMNLPYDSISPLEVEGERGTLHEEFEAGPVGQAATF